MTYLAAFFEGVITFVSPCLLPLLPVYLAYFAGGVTSDDEGGSTMRTALGAAGFVAGFSLLFMALGAFAGTLGSLLFVSQRWVDLVCGLVVILLGLNYLGVVKIELLSRTVRLDSGAPRAGILGPFLLGIVFAVGWSPCVGTFLAAALSLAASSGGALQGTVMLLCYSLGLGVPFVLTAVLAERLEGAFAWVKAHYDLVNRVCGVLLVVVGVLMATGHFGTWMRLLAP